MPILWVLIGIALALIMQLAAIGVFVLTRAARSYREDQRRQQAICDAVLERVREEERQARPAAPPIPTAEDRDPGRTPRAATPLAAMPAWLFHLPGRKH